VTKPDSKHATFISAIASNLIVSHLHIDYCETVIDESPCLFDVWEQMLCFI